MTLKLWRALNNPPATHPIFVRTVLLPRDGKRQSISSVRILIGFIVSMSEFMPTLLIFLMPILLAGCGLVYGLDCAIRVSQVITFERKNNTYELLALCPQGALAVCWVMCTSSLYQQEYFRRLHEIVRTSVQIALVVIGVLLVLVLCFSSSLIVSSSRMVLPILIPLANFGAVAILIYSEYVQSTVIGCLIGLVIPTFTNTTLEPFFYAPVIFLLIKIGTYATSVVVGFNLLDGIYQQLGLQSSLTDILLSLMRLAVIVGIQDGIIRLLWWIVLRRTDTLPQNALLVLYPQG